MKPTLLSEDDHLRLPGRLLRHFLIASEQVVGSIGLDAALKKAAMERYIRVLPFDDADSAVTLGECCDLIWAFHDLYGRAGPDLLIRIGEAVFDQIIRDSKHDAWQVPAFRPETPRDQRLSAIGDQLDHLTARSHLSQITAIRVVHDHLEVRVYGHPPCKGLKHDAPLCYVIVGVLRALSRQATGQEVAIRETQCVATGAPACRFEITLKPERCTSILT